MEFEIYFFTQICIHNNFSKWKIYRSLYPTSSKNDIIFLIFEDTGAALTLEPDRIWGY